MVSFSRFSPGKQKPTSPPLGDPSSGRISSPESERLERSRNTADKSVIRKWRKCYKFIKSLRFTRVTSPYENGIFSRKIVKIWVSL